MTTLNENQILFLQFILTEKGIKEDSIQEELIDHIGLSIEEKMNQNILFHDAVDKAFVEFGEENIMAIRQQHKLIVRKKRIRKAAILLPFSLLLSIPSVFMIWNQESDKYMENIPFAIEKESPKAMNTSINIEPPEISPVLGNFPIVSSFGKRRHPVQKVTKFHKGVDIKAPIGTPVVATSNGEVIQIKLNDTGYGKHIIIKHDKSFKTLYAHLSKIDVKKGDTLKKGQKIGEVGTSGSSLSPHLHYEVIKEGEKVNPEEYIRM